jgi:hypothetical protein
MSSNNCIIPECYIDSCLLEVLLIADKNYVNHQKGNGTVAREMKNKFAKNFCIGIIDEDRRQLDYLKEFNIEIDAGTLKLWKHKSWPQYIIQVCPVVEDWILSICKKEKIILADYNLPSELLDLKRQTKNTQSKHDQRFVKLFKELLKRNIESVVELKRWLEYLKENKYNADINQLKNG